MFDSAGQRRIMGMFATGVTVVTTRYGNGDFWGMTANSVVSLSLNPPLILVTVDRRNHFSDCLRQGECFAVNILKSDQPGLSQRFAARGPKRFDDLDLAAAVTGAPILPNILAYIDCRLIETIRGGDHDIFVGEAAAGSSFEGEPLVFYSGQYTRLVLPHRLPFGQDTNGPLSDPCEFYAAF